MKTVQLTEKKFDALLDIIQAAEHLLNHLANIENGKWLNNAGGEELKLALKDYYNM